MKICPSGPSCCNRHVESRLGTWSVQQFKDGLFNKTTQMAAELDAKATQVDGEYVFNTSLMMENKLSNDISKPKDVLCIFYFQTTFTFC